MYAVRSVEKGHVWWFKRIFGNCCTSSIADRRVVDEDFLNLTKHRKLLGFEVFQGYTTWMEGGMKDVGWGWNMRLDWEW